MKKRIVKLTESDIEKIVSKVLIKESLDLDWGDVHDSLLYLEDRNDAYALGKGIIIYDEIKSAIDSSSIKLPQEARELISRIDYDISGVEGIVERIQALYNILENLDYTDPNI